MASQCTLKTPQGPRYFLPLEMLIVSTVAVNINYIAANNGSSEALLRIEYLIHQECAVHFAWIISSDPSNNPNEVGTIVNSIYK